MADGPQIEDLKELVKVSLQQAGVLGSIKAQLRAEVFKVVNKEQAASAAPPPRLAAIASQDGQVAADLVREFMEHLQLHSTLAVFLPEANLDEGYPGRAQLAQRLGLREEPGVSLIVSMMKQGGPTAGSDSNVSATKAGGAISAAPPQGKFGFGGEQPGGDGKSLATLSDMPSLPGSGKKTDGLSERVAKLQSLAGESAERRADESDESLTSTTRRLYTSKPSSPAGGGGKATPPKAAAPSPSQGRGKPASPSAVETESDYDVVEEDIETLQSDPDTPSPYTGKRGGHVGAGGVAEASMSESCTEVSISDRSVDGSMALEAFDHIEAVAR